MFFLTFHDLVSPEPFGPAFPKFVFILTIWNAIVIPNFVKFGEGQVQNVYFIGWLYMDLPIYLKKQTNFKI